MHKSINFRNRVTLLCSSRIKFPLFKNNAFHRVKNVVHRIETEFVT